MPFIAFFIGFIFAHGATAQDLINCPDAISGARTEGQVDSIIAHASAPFLFPEIITPPIKTDFIQAARSVQDKLDVAQIIRHPDRALLRKQLRERYVFPKLVIATHQLPRLQAGSAAWIENERRFVGVPRLALASPMYGVRSAEFAATIDYILASDHGETVYQPVAKEVFLIGGFESQCLSNTFAELTESAYRAGLVEITIHLPTNWIYSQNHYLRRILETGSDLLFEYAMVEQRAVPGTLRRFKENGQRRVRFQVLSDFDSAFAASRRMKVVVIVE